MSENKLLLYKEVVENYTWYQINSNFKDPMYQYIAKIRQDMQKAMYVPSSNFILYDTYVVNSKDQLFQNGTIQCSAPGKEASMDSMISCLLFQLPFFLEKIQIGYIGFVFVIPILLISIFGGINESYKWFILNQAIWDAFVCYDFICARPTLIGWTSKYYTESTCFYLQNSNPNYFIYSVAYDFRQFFRSGPFIPVFLLAFSRFICMYFSRFYKRFTKSAFSIFIFILAFNIFCILLFCAPGITTRGYANALANENKLCLTKYCEPKNYTTKFCFENVQEYFQCQNRVVNDVNFDAYGYLKWTSIFTNISRAIVPVMFLLSIICSGFLFYKIATQIKFQLKTNRESFKQTIKISSVVGFQCIIMSIIFVITAIQKYMNVKAEILANYHIYNDLPQWLLLLQYPTTTISLNMIRVFLDSVLILTILTGYSRCVIVTFKFAYLSLINPKAAFKKIKNKILKSSNNSTTDISIY